MCVFCLSSFILIPLEDEERFVVLFYVGKPLFCLTVCKCETERIFRKLKVVNNCFLFNDHSEEIKTNTTMVRINKLGAGGADGHGSNSVHHTGQSTDKLTVGLDLRVRG